MQLPKSHWMPSQIRKRITPSTLPPTKAATTARGARAKLLFFFVFLLFSLSLSPLSPSKKLVRIYCRVSFSRVFSKTCFQFNRGDTLAKKMAPTKRATAVPAPTPAPAAKAAKKQKAVATKEAAVEVVEEAEASTATTKVSVFCDRFSSFLVFEKVRYSAPKRLARLLLRPLLPLPLLLPLLLRLYLLPLARRATRCPRGKRPRRLVR